MVREGRGVVREGWVWGGSGEGVGGVVRGR